MSSPAPNPEVIRSTWRWLAHGAHGVSEVRVIRPAGGIVGINVDRVILKTYLLASLVAAPDALLYSMDKGVAPEMGLAALFSAAIATIVGGVGSAAGSALAMTLRTFCSSAIRLCLVCSRPAVSTNR